MIRENDEAQPSDCAAKAEAGFLVGTVVGGASEKAEFQVSSVWEVGQVAGLLSSCPVCR